MTQARPHARAGLFIKKGIFMGWNGSDGKINYPRQRKRKRTSNVMAWGSVLAGFALIGFLLNCFLNNDNSLDSTDDLNRSLNNSSEYKMTKNNSDETELKKSKSRLDHEENHASEPSEASDIQTSTPELKLENLPVLPPPPLQKSHFTEASDQVISMVINTEDAIAPVPLGPNFDNEFKKSLATKIVINDDDPEDVKEAKRNVIAVRKELKALIAEGKSPREALEAHRAEINKIYEARAMVVQEAVALRDKEGEESAAEFLKLANDYLESKGYQRVRLRERPRQ